MAAKTTYTVAMNDEATAALREIQKQLKGVAQGVEDTAKSADALKNFETLDRLAGIFAALKDSVVEAFNAYRDAEETQAKLVAVLNATGDAVGLTAGQIGELGDKLAHTTLYSDDAAKSALVLISTFKNIKGDTLERTADAAADLATVMGTDIKSAAEQLGRALEAPATGVDSLRRANIVLSDAVKDSIKAMADQGNIAGAQALLLDEVQARYGGAAKAMADTASGSVTRLSNSFDELQENIGRGLAPTVQLFANGLRALSDAAGALPPGILASTTVMGAFAAGLPIAVLGIKKLISIVKELQLGLSALAGPWGIAIAAITAGFGILTYAMSQAAEKQKELQEKTQDYIDTLNQSVSGKAVQTQLEAYVIQANATGRAIADITKQIDAVRAAWKGRGDALANSTAGKGLADELALLQAQKKALDDKIPSLQAQAKAEKEAADNAKKANDLAKAKADQERAAAAARALAEEAEKKRLQALLDILEKYRQAWDDIDADYREKIIPQSQKYLEQVDMLGQKLADAQANLIAATATGQSPEVWQKRVDEIQALIEKYNQLAAAAGLAEAKTSNPIAAPHDQYSLAGAETPGLSFGMNNTFGKAVTDIKTARANIEKEWSDMLSYFEHNPPTFDSLVAALDLFQQTFGQTISQIASQISDIFSAQADAQASAMQSAVNDLQKQEDALATTYQAQVDQAKAAGQSTTQIDQQYADDKAVLDAKIAAKKDELARKQFEADKANKIAQIEENAALAVLTAYSQLGPALGTVAAIVIEGLAQTEAGIVSGQQYVPQLAEGGIIAPRSGGTLVNVGEAGQAEAVVPLPSQGLGATYIFNFDGQVFGSLDDFAAAMSRKIDDLKYRGVLR